MNLPRTLADLRPAPTTPASAALLGELGGRHRAGALRGELLIDFLGWRGQLGLVHFSVSFVEALMAGFSTRSSGKALLLLSFLIVILLLLLLTACPVPHEAGREKD